MDIGNILNTKGGAAAAAAAAATEAQLRQQLEQAAHMHAPTNSDLGSDQNSGSSHRQHMHQIAHMSNGMNYPSSQHHGMSMMSNGFLPGNLQDDGFHQSTESDTGRQSMEGAPKAFACSTCAKGFARRSDLARHGQ